MTKKRKRQDDDDTTESFLIVRRKLQTSCHVLLIRIRYIRSMWTSYFLFFLRDAVVCPDTNYFHVRFLFHSFFSFSCCCIVFSAMNVYHFLFLFRMSQYHIYPLRKMTLLPSDPKTMNVSGLHSVWNRSLNQCRAGKYDGLIVCMHKLQETDDV